MITSRRFGVTFHDNMDVATMVKQWNKVDPNLRAANPKIEAAMIVAGGANTLQAAEVVVESTARKVFKVSQLLTELEASTLVGNVGYPAAQAGVVAAGGIQAGATSALTSEKNALFELVK